MPTYDLSQTVKNADGSEGRKNDKPFTIKDAFEEALLSDYAPEGRSPPPDVRAKRFKLWRKLARNEGAIFEASFDESKTLHDCAAAFPTLTYGQLLEVLDGPGVTGAGAAKS